MKDLTKILKNKSIFSDEEKDIKEDIKVGKSKYSKYVGIISSAIAITLYLIISILIGSSVTQIIIWLPFLLYINVNTAIDVYFKSKREKREAFQNLRDLSIELSRIDVDVNTERLTKSLIKENKNKDKVEYVIAKTNEKVLNHINETDERQYIFMDNDEQIRCLKEIKQIIIDQMGTEKEHSLYLLEEDEFDENNMSDKDIRKLRKRYQKRD